MENTKEGILSAALRLFAKDGYEAASMREIAEQLGITKGALYKHYGSKQEIIDSIVGRMRQNDAGNAAAFNVPDGTFHQTPGAHRVAAFGKIKELGLAMFEYWTQDEFASRFRRMLTLEQYRNPEMAALLNQYLTGGVIGYTEDLIREAASPTASKGKDPKVLAVQYFAPIYMMMNLYDSAVDKDAITRMAEKHIDYFIESMDYKSKGK
jgi:AcrR family transcriptional regulator